MMKSRRDLQRLQMSSGNQGLNRGTSDSIEGNVSILETKDYIGKGRWAARRVRSALQSQKKAVRHKDGFGGRHDDGRRLLRVRERQKKVLGCNAKVEKVSQQYTDVLRQTDE